MLRLAIGTITFLFAGTILKAQDAASVCAAHKRAMFAAKTSVASPTEDNYDIKHVKIDVALDNQSVAIQGTVTVNALVTAPQMGTYTFELDSQFTIGFVQVNGINLPVNSQKDIRNVGLLNPLPAGSSFTAVIQYHGQPWAGNGYFQQGLNNTDADTFKIKATYTLSEPYMASQWWPCKQSLQDKIDSADIWVTIPPGLKAGSNGLLRNITALPDGRQRYEWHTNYPIDYYLLSVSVAPYQDYSYHISLPGVTDSMLVQNFIYDAPGSLALYKNGLDSTTQILQYFSQLFGTYPFYKEKYGHCILPLPGGMEHQTMTSCGDAGTNLVSHELAHQWFGDHVTCASWKDIWLNEGFASYGEYLFLEHFRPAEAAGHMQGFHDKVLNNKEKRGTIYVDDTTGDRRIFDERLSYTKPAAVLHMLRYVTGNDRLFFLLLKKYQQQYAFSNANTQQFKTLAEQTLNRNLGTFFDQWIYKEGYPIYTVYWNQVGDKIFIRLDQSTAVPESVKLFYTPIQLKLSGLSGDTTLTIYNDTVSQFIRLNWETTMTDVAIDPNNYILNGDGGMIHDPELGLNEVTSGQFKVWPNPARSYWCITGLTADTDWLITDAKGQIVRSGNTGSLPAKVVYTDGMASGAYVFVLLQGKHKIQTAKLIKY